MNPETTQPVQAPQAEIDPVMEHNPDWPNSPGMDAADIEGRLLAAHSQSAAKMDQEINQPSDEPALSADTQPRVPASV